MTNNIFKQYPYWLDSTAWYELIRAKNKNDEDKIIRLSSPIIIENKFLDPTTGVEKLTITDGKNIERIETSDILTTQKLPRLVMFGFSINEKYIKSLGNALQLMRQSLPISKLYTGVGVLSTDEGTVISLDEPYLSKDIEQSQADEIICETKYDLQPKGTFEGWWQMYLDEVKGNLLLELAVIFGVSSLVTAFLKTKHEVEYFGTIFSFMGNSSTGKSTAAALAVSIAGNPSKGDQTLFRGWNGTRNAIEGYLSNNFGVPIALDELSAATFKDTNGLLYSLAEGQGRLRANREGNVKNPHHFGSSVISTAEHTIFKDASANDGLRARCIEISDVFTTSADNADAIKKGTSKNYGHVMPLVAEYLLNRESEVIKWFHKEHDWFKAQLNNETNNVGIRMFKRYATITTSARILERVIATPIDLDAVREYLVSYHVDSVSERSLGAKAIDSVVQFVARNRSKFAESKKLSIMTENYGLIELKDDHIQVKMLKDVFKHMLEENQYQDVKIVIDSLRAEGYIQMDSDRIAIKRNVKDTQGKTKTILFYHLVLPSEFAPVLGLSSNSEPYTPPQFDNNTTNKELLNKFVKDGREWEEKGDLEL
ncbi:cassette chromosome replicative helicase [Staphylococcus cohnii species complex 1638]|uniref:cassette chromosome replicative helicase n=1 Tax=Staphylococcus cohnii species complex 1638 TaxID=3239425 RepID=UPI0034D616D8